MHPSRVTWMETTLSGRIKLSSSDNLKICVHIYSNSCDNYLIGLFLNRSKNKF